MHRGHIDDAPPIGRLHGRQRQPRGVKCARQVDGDHRIPALDREVFDLGHMLDAGVVDQNVDPAKALGGKAHHGLDLGRPAHVCAVVGHLHAQRLYLRLCSGHIAKAVEHQIGALGRQGLGKAQADAAGRSGHECCFAFKHEILLCNWGDNSHLRRAGPLVQP
jgi:hypothetical protein